VLYSFPLLFCLDWPTHWPGPHFYLFGRRCSHTFLSKSKRMLIAQFWIINNSKTKRVLKPVTRHRNDNSRHSYVISRCLAMLSSQCNRKSTGHRLQMNSTELLRAVVVQNANCKIDLAAMFFNLPKEKRRQWRHWSKILSAGRSLHIGLVNFLLVDNGKPFFFFFNCFLCQPNRFLTRAWKLIFFTISHRSKIVHLVIGLQSNFFSSYIQVIRYRVYRMYLINYRLSRENKSTAIPN